MKSRSVLATELVFSVGRPFAAAQHAREVGFDIGTGF